jgi:adenylate cyclase
MRFRLQVTVAAAFTLLTAAMLGVAVWSFAANNRQLAIETAQAAMARAQARTQAALGSFVAPAVRAVETSARLAAAFPDAVRTPAGLEAVAAQIAGLDHISGLFFADEANGAFWHAARIEEGARTFGPSGVAVPKGAVRVLRSIVPGGTGSQDSITFLSATGAVLGRSVMPSDFDARTRPWYAAALDTDGVAVSPVYLFASTGRPGVTLSRRVRAADGRVRAVAGLDVSLGRLAAVLADVRVDGVGEVFLLDPQGRILASSEAPGGGPAPLTQAAVEAWTADRRAMFRFVPGAAGGGHLVSMAQMDTILAARPLLGVIVPERHFVGPIVDTTRDVLLVSAAVLVAAVALTVVLARLLSGSLRTVADEARRISAFDLTGDFRMTSNIAEVHDLGTAVGAMKNSLASFGSYVPKEVVRALVAAGGRVEVGGAAREVTLLFSDIEGFTRKSERLPPETAMTDLSRYFAAMSDVIAAHGGTIDKYIGDAVMALWNAPLDEPRHSELACRAALACQAAEAALNAAAGAGPTLFPTRTRFGLNRDRVVVGNVGSPDRLQYTAIGGAVNLASRIEGLNKLYGTGILAARPVADAVGGAFLFRPVDFVMPAGTTQPVEVLEVVGEADGAGMADLARAIAAWEAALARYRARDWEGAAAAMRALPPGAAGKEMVALYLSRCARFAADPPPADWAGAHALADK